VQNNLYRNYDILKADGVGPTLLITCVAERQFVG